MVGLVKLAETSRGVESCFFMHVLGDLKSSMRFVLVLVLCEFVSAFVYVFTSDSS